MSELSTGENKLHVDVTSFSSGRSKSITLGEFTPLPANGGEAFHYFVPVSLKHSGKERNAGTFVVKSFTDPSEGLLGESDGNYDENVINDYMQHYNFLKENGFPVPTTVSRIEGKKGLLVSDLRFGGNTVFSLNELFHETFNPGKITNFDEVKEDLENLADKGEKIGMVIAESAYYFLFNPTTGRTQVMIGDIGAGIYLPGEYEYDSGDGDEPWTCKGEVEKLLSDLNRLKA